MRGVRFCSRRFAVLAGVALLASVAVNGSAAEKKAGPLTEDQRIRHALDRLGFGPRPGDMERVRRLGLDRYIEQQLHPETIPEPLLDAHLGSFATLGLPPGELTESFRSAMGRGAAPAASDEARREAQRAYRAYLVRVVGELQVAKALRAVQSGKQLQEVMVDFWTNHFNIDVRKGPARALKTVDDREVIRAHALGRFRDLLGASAKSPAMLIYLDNARSSVALPAGRRGQTRGGLNENYARELLELHTLGVDGGYTQKDVVEVARCFTGWTLNPRTGRFLFTPRRHDDGAKTVLGTTIPAGGGVRDGERVLDLLASHPSTAKHIARKLCQRLLADEPPVSVVDRAAGAFRKSGGDIRAVVKAIVTSPDFFSPTTYRSKVKSPFEYAVSAARALDGRMELFSAVYNQPGVPPWAFAGRSLVGRVAAMGEPLFQCQAPTGYPEDSRRWVSAGALVARINFAQDLVNSRVPGVRISEKLTVFEGTSEEMLRAYEKTILHEEASSATRAAILRQMGQGEDKAFDVAKVTAMLLASPEFQRR